MLGHRDFDRVILVTGGNGFIGRALARELWRFGSRVRAAVRDGPAVGPPSAESDCIAVGEVGPRTDWSAALQDVDTVVHLAARAHKLREASVDQGVEYRKVNVLGSVRLASQCIERGVKRLVFVSTIGVHGWAAENRSIAEDSPISPIGPYAASKWEAERELRKIADKGDLELVIVRPPAVYGPGAKGNMERLLWLVFSGWPLPLGGVSGQRSFIGLGNLVDFLRVCATDPAAADETFVICDGEDMSSRDLVRRIAAASGKSVSIWYCPLAALRFGGTLLGRRDDIERLCSPLRVDAGRAHRVFRWTPPYSVDEEVGRMADWWLAQQTGPSQSPV